MTAKTLYALIVAALLALIVAVAINSSKKPLSDTAAQAKPLLPELRDHVNDVNAITLTGAEGKVLTTLKRGDGGWTVPERSNYPADLAKVRELLLKLNDATLVEQKTANKDRYADLGVGDVKEKDAKGVLVEVSGLAQPVRLIVGNYNGAGGGGTFVRRDGDAQSWLAKGNLTLDKAAANWLKRDLSDIASSRLKEIALTGPDGRTLKASKEQSTDTNFKLADVPKGREPSSEFVANALSSALSGLRADDALAAKDAAPGDKVYKAHYAAFDGLQVDATAWEKDGKDYAQFVARLDQARADAQIQAEQAKAKVEYEARVAEANKKVVDAKPDAGAVDEAGKSGTPQKDSNAEAAATVAATVAKPLAISDAAKDRDERMAALNKEVQTLNTTFGGWTFVLPTYKFANINKTMDDMLKPIEQKKPDSKDAKKPAATAPPKKGG